MRPNLGAVVIHKYRDIANHANCTVGAVTPQGAPLLVESELQCTADLNVIREFLARLL